MAQTEDGLQIGLFAINEESYCSTKANLCLRSDNTYCAFVIYMLSGWGYWEKEAKACGCSTSGFPEAKLEDGS